MKKKILAAFCAGAITMSALPVFAASVDKAAVEVGKKVVTEKAQKAVETGKKVVTEKAQKAVNDKEKQAQSKTNNNTPPEPPK